MSAEENLKRLGLELPPPAKPVATYVTTVRAGGLLQTSGHVPPAGTPKAAGKLGKDLTVEEGYAAARAVGLSLLATARAALGSLDRIERVVRVLGFVNAVPEFPDHPKVINGCSDLFVQVFGEPGRAARSAVGAGSLPGGVAVEIEAVFAVA